MSDFNNYQRAARDTAIYPGKGTTIGEAYCALGLNGEAGEVAEIVKKKLRDNLSADGVRERILKESGDVLWYLANLLHEYHISLDEVASENLRKLASRKARGTLQGSGDDR